MSGWLYWCCWWKKTCTSWYREYPTFHRVSYVTGGAGFLPSTVPYADTYSMRVDIHVHLTYFCLGWCPCRIRRHCHHLLAIVILSLWQQCFNLDHFRLEPVKKWVLIKFIAHHAMLNNVVYALVNEHVTGWKSPHVCFHIQNLTSSFILHVLTLHYVWKKWATQQRVVQFHEMELLV